MKNNVLFISDGSLTNPIVSSQGLPLLKFLSRNNYNCFMIHFESAYLEKSNEEKILNIQDLYKNIINFQKILINKYRFLPGSIVNGARSIFFILSLAVNYKFKVFHARSFYPATICLILKYFFPKTKFIYDNRGLFIQEEIFKGRWKENSLSVRILRMIENRIVKKTNHIVVVSNAFREYMLENFSTICSHLDKKITVIDNKTNINQKLNNTKINIRKKNKNVVGVFAGSAARWQSVSEIKAFAQMCCKIIPNFSLKILSYNLDVFMKEIQNDSSLYNITEFIEAKSSEVFEHLLSANFGLLIRDDILINNVASPLKFAEYLAAGLPVAVSSGVGDTEEIIHKNDIGVIIKEKNYEYAVNQLMVLLDDDDVYNRCMQTALKEYNITDSYYSYNGIYQDILKEN